MRNIITILTIFLIQTACIYSQNITNTLGTSGVFKIKDGTTDFFTLNQSTGTIDLISSIEGSQRGSILKGNRRFLHTYFGTGTIGQNTFIGVNSGNFSLGGGFLDAGSFNTGTGHSVLSRLTTGYSNSAYGSLSLLSTTSGYQNSAFGEGSLVFNITGYQNTAIGCYTLFENQTGWHNTAVGFDALKNNYTGWQNTAIGHHSLLSNTGNYNTAIGYNSGSTVTTGSNLTLIGIDANPTSPTATDQITLGNQFVTSLRCNVTTITSLSDRRDKSNIKELSVGLDFITKLKPRQFNWDRREWYKDGISDGSRMNEVPTAGFIAQELDSAQTRAGADWLSLVLKDNPEKWEATPGNLLPVMVKAIQELNEKCEKLHAENEKLKNDLEQLNVIKEKLTVLMGLIDETKQNNKEIKFTEK